MKTKALSIGIAGLLLASCSDDPTSPGPAAEQAVVPHRVGTGGVALDQLAPPEYELRELFLNAERTEVAHGVAHYQFEVPLGAGQFDVVRIHRVVRERKPYHPVRTHGAVFMTHGASLTFEAIFLRPGTNDADTQTSVAVYLAANGIDVWGMDFAWTLVPVETTDFSFMQDWGVERDVDHTLAAMSIARLIRGHTRQGFGRMNLLGYSYGVGVAYAAAGRETQQHRFLRDIRGIVPVDQVMKYAAADESSRLVACADAAASQDLIDSGVFQNDQGAGLGFFSDLASTAPDEESPIIPGLTNFQAALFIGTNTFVLSPPPAPFWHFVGGDFNEFGIPDGLLYSDPSRWIRLLGSLPPYMPELAVFEVAASGCDEEDVSIDDHLAEISVPILYLGAGGGFGTVGDFTSSLTASHDVTNHTVSVQPDEQRIIDYGHADLFLGDDANGLVWEVLRHWLVRHGTPVPHAGLTTARVGERN